MLQNAYFLAKIGADTAENERHFAEILPIGRRVADRPSFCGPNSVGVFERPPLGYSVVDRVEKAKVGAELGPQR